MPANIQPLIIEDLEAVYALESQAHAHWTRRMIEDCFTANYLIYGCWQDKQLIAYVVLTEKVDEAEILNIVVADEYQQQGHGQALMQYALAQVRAQKIKKVFLELRESNDKALKLYQRLDFRLMLTRKNYYHRGEQRENALVMMKTLEGE